MKASFFINKPSNVLPETLTTNILKSSDALSFHSTLPGYNPTPLIYLPALADKYGVSSICLKDESYRFGLNSFKSLGAVYAISQILKKNPELEVFCTATDGNHGKAVAWSARMFNKNSVVYVPEDTTDNRIKAIENEGAKVEKVAGDYDYACEYAEQASIKNGWQLVQDMAWDGYEEIPANIVSGYMTQFKEMEKEVNTLPEPKVDIVFLQAGVGSFAGSGVYYYLNRYGKKRPKIAVIEPNEADAVYASFLKNEVTTSKGSGKTIMAGLNCGTPSTGTWDILKNGVDVSVKVDDDYAKLAMRELYYPPGDDKRIIAGESGVGGLAGFIAIMTNDKLKPVRENLNINKNTNILFISTEGATDVDVFNEIIKSC